jgi:hypothetical protein
VSVKLRAVARREITYLRLVAEDLARLGETAPNGSRRCTSNTAAGSRNGSAIGALQRGSGTGKESTRSLISAPSASDISPRGRSRWERSLRGGLSGSASATPSLSTVRFYLGRGFEPMSEPLPELYKLEPDDVHMQKRL